MPLSKSKKSRKKNSDNNTDQVSELVLKSDDTEYGQIIKSIGNGFMQVMCYADTGKIQRRAHIRGKMRKRVWLVPGDIVLVNCRGYQDDTCDILMKYTTHEIRMLKSKHQLPENVDADTDSIDLTCNNIVFTDTSCNETNTSDANLVALQTRKYDLPDSDSDSEIDLTDL